PALRGDVRRRGSVVPRLPGAARARGGVDWRGPRAARRARARSGRRAALAVQGGRGVRSARAGVARAAAGHDARRVRGARGRGVAGGAARPQGARQCPRGDPDHPRGRRGDGVAADEQGLLDPVRRLARALRRAHGAMEVLAGCRDRRADDAHPPIPVRGFGRVGTAPGAHPQSPERAARGPDRVVARRSGRSPGNGYENATWTGLSRRWRAPPSVWSPSCPAASQPQHHIDPVLFTAQVWRLPAVIRTTPESLPLPYTTW